MLKCTLTIALSLLVLSALPTSHAQEEIQVELLRTLGRGAGYGIAWSPDGETIAVASSVGVWLYNTSNFDAPPQFLSEIEDNLKSVAYRHSGGLACSGFLE